MTIQPRYLTSHSQYLCNHTHLIDDITPYVCMKAHPLHVGNQRHYLRHHILSWWHHTIVCTSWHPLCLWDHIPYIWCHTHCVYDKPSSISDLKYILYAITSTVYVITPTLSETSHQLCKITGGISKPSCTIYMTQYPHFKTKTLRIYDVTCPLLIKSHALYMTGHLLCMISHSLYVWHHTMPVSLTSHTLLLWHIHFMWHHTQCYENTTIVYLHSHYVWHHTLCIFVITPSGWILSNPVYVWNHSHYVYDIIWTTYDIISTI